MTAARTVGLLALAARVVGFLRWLAFAWAVGAAGLGSIYQTINTVPNVVYEVTAGGMLAAIIVPVVAQAARLSRRADSPESIADQVVSALVNRALLGLLPVTIFVMLTASWLARLLLGDQASPEAITTGTRLLWLFAPQILLYAVAAIMTGALQARHRFVAAALAPLVSSLVVIATYLLYGQLGVTSSLGVWILGGGTTAGVVALLSPSLAGTWRRGWRWRSHWALPAHLQQRLRVLAAAGALAVAAQQLTSLVWLALANRADPSTPAVLGYTQAVYLLPYAVLCVPLATVAFPRLAESGPAVRQSLADTHRSLWVVSAVCAVALAVTAADIGRLFQTLDRTGAAAARNALASMGPALVAFAPGLVGLSVSALLLRALYAHGPALHAAGSVAVGWACALAGPILLPVGTIGVLVSLGTWWSIGMCASALLLAGLVARSWGPGSLGSVRAIALETGRATLSAGIAGGLVWWAGHALLDPRMPTWGAALLAGGGAGGAALAAGLFGQQWRSLLGGAHNG